MEAESFETLVALHMVTMVHVAAALVGTADAEDTTQEAILRAWRSWSALRDAEAVRSWLMRIVVNVCYDWQRGQFGRQRRMTASLNDHPYMLAIFTSDPGNSDHTGEIDLRQAINSLAEDLRQVVALRYYAGMDATEIGLTLGVPAATIRTRLRRALTLLREQLDPQSHPSFPATRRH